MLRYFLYNTADVAMPPSEFFQSSGSEESSGSESIENESTIPPYTYDEQSSDEESSYIYGGESSYGSDGENSQNSQNSQSSQSGQTSRESSQSSRESKVETTVPQPTTAPHTEATTAIPTTSPVIDKKQNSNIAFWVVLWVALALAVAALGVTIALLIRSSKKKKAQNVNPNYPNQNYPNPNYPNQNYPDRNSNQNPAGYGYNNPNIYEQTQYADNSMISDEKTQSPNNNDYFDNFNNRR